MEFRQSVATCTGFGGEVASADVSRSSFNAVAPGASRNFSSRRLRHLEAFPCDGGRVGENRNSTKFRAQTTKALRRSRGSDKFVVVPRCDGGGRLPGRQGPGGFPMSMNPSISPPGLGQFKPPPTTWVPLARESEEEKNRAAERAPVLVDKLKNGAGTWQERAAFVKELQQIGVTSEELYSMTFVPIVKQLEIVVAAQVYESLAQSGTSPEILQELDESSTAWLYALRTLSATQRQAALEYSLANSLTVEETEKLAAAIKDYLRRSVGRKGFSAAPGDCLAFIYHRQATESQDLEVRQSFIELGLKAATTESARERFSEFST